MNNNSLTPEVATPDSLKPHYIREQHNHNCQQFFGPVSNCVFAMPGANVTQPSGDNRPSGAIRRTPSLARPSAADIKAAKAANLKRELMTFRTRGVHDANLSLLYQQMVKDGWIDERTLSDDFLALFSGQRSECKVIWAGKYGKGTLVFLFEYFEVEGCITTDQGFSIPNILMGHFVDTNGRFLTRLDKGDAANNRAANEVQAYVKIMKYNPAKGVMSADGGNCSDGMFDDGTYDPFDHRDLHLHRR